ncbi:hypothetical protein KA005_30495, partial [bacterium]|nr:hypothetical protein [bacterium]
MARKGKADVLIDIKGDQKDLDKAIKKSNSGLKGMAKDAKASGMALAKMAAVGVAALGTMTYAAWNVTKGFKDYGVELDKTNKITGIGADKISQIAYAAEQEHASIEDLQTGWRRLSKAMSDADEGLAESVRSFDSIGVSIYDATGQLKSLDVMTLDVADALKEMTNDTQKAALAQEIFGRSGMNLIPFFELGSDGIHDLMEESKALGNVWTDEMARGAKLFDDKLTALGYSFKAVKWQIGNALMPEFEKITDWFMTNKDWLIQTFKDIFKFDVENFGESVTIELDKIKTWTETNKDTLSDMWSGFITATDVAITGAKILLTSIATIIAAQRYVLAGFKEEDLETLREVSAKTLDVHIAAGEKPWM